jgi:hypothetical protein
MLVKIGFSCYTLTVRLARVRTSTVLQQAVCPAQHRAFAIWVLGENLIFSQLSAYSSTPRTTRNTLKLSSLVYNIHAT